MTEQIKTSTTAPIAAPIPAYKAVGLRSIKESALVEEIASLTLALSLIGLALDDASVAENSGDMITAALEVLDETDETMGRPQVTH